MTTSNSSIGRMVGSFALLVGLVVSALVVTDRPASAYTYNREAAAAYAQKYACNGQSPGACRNRHYHYYKGGDCTNFVSQALLAGGMPMDLSGGNMWFIDPNGSSTPSWRIVESHKTYMKNAGRMKVIAVNRLSAYTPAKKGDVFIYEFGHKNGGWDHLSIVTGWGQFGSYYDRGLRRNYNSVTGGKGDKIAQHTTDRDGAPWNWHYWSGTAWDKKVNKVYLLRVQ